VLRFEGGRHQGRETCVDIVGIHQRSYSCTKSANEVTMESSVWAWWLERTFAWLANQGHCDGLLL
jgi:hypothetical protein